SHHCCGNQIQVSGELTWAKSSVSTWVEAVVEAEPWCAEFLRSSKYDDLKRLEAAILDRYEGTDMCTSLLKLIDKVRNNG
ncbi:MAG: hypothetical protein RSG92_27815, partial [Pseudomonas sp.]